MIGVRVGDDDRGQRADTLALEKRDHHPATRIAMLARRAGVYDDPATTRRAEHRPVALAHIEKM
jgi:hypothetical protein